MPETNGNGRSLEIGKLMGSLDAFEKGQDALFRDLGELQNGISEIKQKHIYYDTRISDNHNDINGLGKKVEVTKDEVKIWIKEARNENKATMRSYTRVIIAVLAGFVAFLSLWMHLTNNKTVTLQYPEKPGIEHGDSRYPGSAGNQP